MTFYYTAEQKLLLEHFMLVKVSFILKKGKPGMDILVIDQLFLVRWFKIQNLWKLIGGILGHNFLGVFSEIGSVKR